MKKIINAAEEVIDDYIDGLVAAGHGLSRLRREPVVLRAPGFRKDPGKVAVISGGGSGHEPAHAGYVGPGMLDGAVLGPVFTSPSADHVYSAIKAVAADAGVLLIVKNYTGDRLNFGIAMEMARADGIDIDMVVVADDVALGDGSRAGRRGLAGTVLVHKLAGALAEQGAGLAGIVAALRGFLPGVGTMGVALGPCHSPGRQEPNFLLGRDEIEWGLGIHGEAGRNRGPLPGSRELAAALVESIAVDRGLAEGAGVAVLVNGLGGTPDLELRIFAGNVIQAVRARGLSPELLWTGAFMTSLEMPGVSVTLAALDDASRSLLLEPAAVPGFGAPGHPNGVPDHGGDLPEAPQHEGRVRNETPAAVAAAHEFVALLCRRLIEEEDRLTALDRAVGDGDLGTNLARGARTILSCGEELAAGNSLPGYFRGLSEAIRRVVGGTSGPLYSLLALGMAEGIGRNPEAPQPEDWGRGLEIGTALIQELGGAQVGDRTMVDALVPAVEALNGAAGDPEAVAAAAQAARHGAEATGTMVTGLGRSSYLGRRALGHPDPGAIAIAILCETAATYLAAMAGADGHPGGGR
ncbi:dihydroxyacetone kinase [Zafaria cholistanensis]|uniref:Dihydroxyacetone kinase n=1 Tax=Zafaria cholistanensis TaxID=1682741 RepID=A0A5A7NTQ0_9MICC|nr:dihydroxyacetone kinase family protein [Zafaria cholistanensis]GER23188.1 dihydroxyacetone kinase [Zafaria cholistanensis]